MPTCKVPSRYCAVLSSSGWRSPVSVTRRDLGNRPRLSQLRSTLVDRFPLATGLEVCGLSGECIHYVVPVVGYDDSTRLALVEDVNNFARKIPINGIRHHPLLTYRKPLHSILKPAIFGFQALPARL